MKKLLSKMFAVMLVLPLAFVFVACGGNGGGGTTKTMFSKDDYVKQLGLAAALTTTNSNVAVGFNASNNINISRVSFDPNLDLNNLNMTLEIVTTGDFEFESQYDFFGSYAHVTSTMAPGYESYFEATGNDIDVRTNFGGHSLDDLINTTKSDIRNIAPFSTGCNDHLSAGIFLSLVSAATTEETITGGKKYTSTDPVTLVNDMYSNIVVEITADGMSVSFNIQIDIGGSFLNLTQTANVAIGGLTENDVKYQA